MPKGRICEIYGPESSGKTTLTLRSHSAMSKTGGTAAFIDAEHALDPIYAKKLGVNRRIINFATRYRRTGSRGRRYYGFSAVSIYCD